ncbi:DUF6461 domain-containing protein [Nonomuraea dietziae]|uniref:DUF6461 domain-containing protein n=1 Tax=Nonomuraea dietziae TaxID=65515 RepID=UPI0031DC1456
MTTTDPLAPFQWLNVSENDGGGGPLGVIFSVAFFSGLDPAEVVRRFGRGEDSGQESDFDGLDDKPTSSSARRTAGMAAATWASSRPASGAWPSSLRLDGTDHEVVSRLSRGCEVLAVTRHDYAAEHSFEYAIDGARVTGYPLRHPYERYGSDPDRLNGFMRELGMVLDKPEDDATWEDNYDNAVPRGFALAAKVTGVSFTPDMLGRPMLVGPIKER